MVEVAHKTNKAGIRATGELKGKGNSDTLTIGGKEFAPGTLVFCGFVAPPPENPQPGPKEWHGYLRFKLGDTDEAARAPFSTLIGSKP